MDNTNTYTMFYTHSFCIPLCQLSSVSPQALSISEYADAMKSTPSCTPSEYCLKGNTLNGSVREEEEYDECKFMYIKMNKKQQRKPTYPLVVHRCPQSPSKYRRFQWWLAECKRAHILDRLQMVSCSTKQKATLKYAL